MKNKPIVALVVFITIAVAGSIAGLWHHAKQRDGNAVNENAPSNTRNLTVRYQGLFADVYGSALFDSDWKTRKEAAYALNQIGKEGMPFIIKGMRSGDANIRWMSLNSFTNYDPGNFKKELLPLLSSLLKDKSGRVRLEAALVLMHSGYKESLPAMQEAFEKESDAEIKKDIGRYIKLLADK